MAVPGSCLHRIRASMHIIAPSFGLMKYKSLYFTPSGSLCGPNLLHAD